MITNGKKRKTTDTPAPKIIGKVVSRHWTGYISYDVTKKETDFKGNTFLTTTTPYEDKGMMILVECADFVFLPAK
jgi:hypothetical protein